MATFTTTTSTSTSAYPDIFGEQPNIISEELLDSFYKENKGKTSDYKIGDLVFIRNNGWIFGNVHSTHGNIIIINGKYKNWNIFRCSREVNEKEIIKLTFKNIKSLLEILGDRKVILKDFIKNNYIPNHNTRILIENLKIKTIKNIAISIFGEEYVDLQNRTLLIHFPEITIENDVGQEHIIRDLFIRLSIRDNGTIFEPLYGTRLTVTENEYNVRYMHSHLEKSRELSYWQRFCLGNTEINKVYHLLSNNYCKSDYILLFAMLKDYVRWESLDGGPHIRMEKIFNGEAISNPSSNSEIRMGYETLIKEKEVLISQINVNQDSFFTVAKEQIENIISKDERIKKYIIDNSGRITSVQQKKSKEELQITNKNLTGLYLTFKGKKINAKVIPSEEKEQSKPVTVDPQVINSVHEKIRKNFINFQIYKIWKQKINQS